LARHQPPIEQKIVEKKKVSGREQNICEKKHERRVKHSCENLAKIDLSGYYMTKENDQGSKVYIQKGTAEKEGERFPEKTT